MIKFHLDKKVELSYYEQIKGQLLSAIYCGKIKEGDRLPSIRELAAQFNVNYKTIRRGYKKLHEDEFLEIIQGSGAFLKVRRGPLSYEKMRRHALYRLFREVSSKIADLGISEQQFARLLVEYSSGRPGKTRLKLAVIDHVEEAFCFAREIRERIGSDVSAVTLGSHEEEQEELALRLREADYFLTTSWHIQEVSVMAEKFRKQVIEIKPSHRIYEEILEAAQTRNIAIVIQDENTMHASWDIYMSIYRPTTEKKFWIATVDNTLLLDEIIAEAEVIFVTPMCWDRMKGLAPASTELRTYESFISEETIDYLKELQLLGRVMNPAN